MQFLQYPRRKCSGVAFKDLYMEYYKVNKNRNNLCTALSLTKTDEQQMQTIVIKTN